MQLLDSDIMLFLKGLIVLTCVLFWIRLVARGVTRRDPNDW